MSKTYAGLLSENAALRERVEIYFRRLQELQRLIATTADNAARAEVHYEMHLPKRPRTATKTMLGPRKSATPASWNSSPANILHVTPGLPNLSLNDDKLGNLLISVCGFGDAQLEQWLEMVLETQTAQRDFAPIFITDSLSFHLFRRYGFAIEYFPLLKQTRVVEGRYSWSSYAKDRLDLLMRKYGVSKVLTIGSIGLESLPTETAR